jgi:hypothetical protein
LSGGWRELRRHVTGQALSEGTPVAISSGRIGLSIADGYRVLIATRFVHNHAMTPDPGLSRQTKPPPGAGVAESRYGATTRAWHPLRDQHR